MSRINILLARQCALAFMGTREALFSKSSNINLAMHCLITQNKGVGWSRAFVLIVNVVLLVLAATGIGKTVLSLFLVGNMVCAATALPVVSGLIQGEAAR